MNTNLSVFDARRSTMDVHTEDGEERRKACR